MIIVLYVAWILCVYSTVVIVLTSGGIPCIKGFISICEMNTLILDFKYLVMLYLKSNIHNKGIC